MAQNQKQEGGVGGGPFDRNKLFKPTNLGAETPSQNPNPNSGNFGIPSASGSSYPPPTGSYSYPYQTPPPYYPNPDAKRMALLGSPVPSFEYSHQPTTPLQEEQSSSEPTPVRMPSSNLHWGRHLVGDHVGYDVDVRQKGEEQPQLEVTPITKYVSDPGLVLGQQIAVNNAYICYGLKLGAIRVLNINTASRYLLRGHTQRVTDMAFFAEDVHLLASGSIDGRVYIWKISEGPGEEEKSEKISEVVVLAIHFTGEDGSVHPRVCWHCHKQEILVVAIGKNVLRIDTTKAGRGVEFVAEEPLECPLNKLIDGIQLVGKHEGEVTDLSMCQWMTTRLVSASKDGTIKIWEDRKPHPLFVLRPHDGQPVDAAKFLIAPHRPDHVMLVTAGPLNREIKLWASSDDEGWLLPSDAESWRCIQTLELKSSAEPQNDKAFFNQVVTLSQAGLLLLANAKKNAIYAIHLEYSSNPAATRMDYLAEFTVTMPILSFTVTNDFLPHGEHLVQLYCVQTQAIQQYAVDLSQCLPPPMEKTVEKTESSVSVDTSESVRALEPSRSKSLEVPFSEAKPSMEYSAEIKCPVGSSSDAFIKQDISTSSHSDVVSAGTPPLPLSPSLSRKPRDNRSDKAVTNYSVDRQIDTAQAGSTALSSSNDDNRSLQGNASDVISPPIIFKHPTHLVTPFEIMATSPGDDPQAAEKGEIEAKVQDVVVSNDTGNVEFVVKEVGESGFVNNDESASQVDHQVVRDRKEKTSFFSQASDLEADMSRECCVLPSESSIMQESQNSINEALTPPSISTGEDDDKATNMSEKATDFSVSGAASHSPAPAAKRKKQKGKNPQASVSSFPQSTSNSVESLQGVVTGSSVAPMEAAFPQLLAMHDSIIQLVNSQKEIQNQMSMLVAVPVDKECRRLEAALGRSVEKAIRANTDALWARIQEENAKQEKLLRDRTQQITGLINNFVSKDLVAMLERTIKKESAAVSTNVARSLTPVVENTITSSISECFQRGVSDKAVGQLEKSVTSKLEATVARQIQTQFQTSGKQALQEGLKASLEASVIPAFEMSCKTIFEQVDTAFQKGLVEHSATAQHQIESMHSQLALTLRDSLNSASSLAQSLSGELADGQRKLLALAAAGANSNSGTQLGNGPLAALHEKVEQPLDPIKELSRLVAEHKYDEAFTAALQRSDVFIVSWLCSQVDRQYLLSRSPLPLSQGVLLSLLQQLAFDITKDTTRKLAWITDVAACLIPHDPMIALHVRPISEQVYQILKHQSSLPTATPTELSNIRVAMHVINSMLMTCK